MKSSESRSVMSDSLWLHGLYSPWNSLHQNTGVGTLSLLQGIFPAQGSNPGLLLCRWILYQLSHKGGLRILEWVAYPISSRSSQLRNWTGFSCIAGGFFTNWAIRETPLIVIMPSQSVYKGSFCGLISRNLQILYILMKKYRCLGQGVIFHREPVS